MESPPGITEKPEMICLSGFLILQLAILVSNIKKTIREIILKKNPM